MDGAPHPSEPLPWFARPQARTWACAAPRQVSSGAVLAFHASLPGYAPTPLTEVPALAAELGAGRVFVKDESSRLGLPAFKVLGASWAVHQLLTGSPAGEPAATAPADGLAGLRELAAGRPGLIFVTATDGNHGRAVARMARLTGCPRAGLRPRRDRARHSCRHRQRGRRGDPGPRQLRRGRRHRRPVGRRSPRRCPDPGHGLARLRAGAGLDRRGLLHPVRRTRHPARGHRCRAAWPGSGARGRRLAGPGRRRALPGLCRSGSCDSRGMPWARTELRVQGTLVRHRGACC